MKLLLATITLIWGFTTLAVHADKHNDTAQETDFPSFIADFDWLVATTGREQFRKPLLTLNRADLTRFATTGNIKAKYRIGPILIEERAAIFLSTKKYPDSSVDQPASVVVKFNDQIIAGAKGLFFNTSVRENYILIEHWDGTLGCSRARWYLEFNLATEALQIAESEYVTLTDNVQCQPE